MYQKPCCARAVNAPLTLRPTNADRLQPVETKLDLSVSDAFSQMEDEVFQHGDTMKKKSLNKSFAAIKPACSICIQKSTTN